MLTAVASTMSPRPPRPRDLADGQRRRDGGGGGGGTLFNTAPTVSLTASPATVQVNTATTLTANASDTDGTIAKVEFYNGATLISTRHDVAVQRHVHADHGWHVHGDGACLRQRGAMTRSSPVIGHRAGRAGREHAAADHDVAVRTSLFDAGNRGHGQRLGDGDDRLAHRGARLVLHERHEAGRRHGVAVQHDRDASRRRQLRLLRRSRRFARAGRDDADPARRREDRARGRDDRRGRLAPAQPGDVRRLAGRSGTRERRSGIAGLDQRPDGEADLGLPGQQVQPDPAHHDGGLHDQHAGRRQLPGRLAAGAVRTRPPDARDGAARLLHQRAVRAGPAAPARGVGAVADHRDVGATSRTFRMRT